MDSHIFIRTTLLLTFALSPAIHGLGARELNSPFQGYFPLTDFSTNRSTFAGRISAKGLTQQETPSIDPGQGALPGVAVQQPLFTRNQEGSPYTSGTYFGYEAQPQLSLSDWFYMEGNFHAARNIDDERSLLYVQRLFAEVHFRNIALSIGRKPIRWGVGKSGQLLLSQNTTPLDSIQVQTKSIYIPFLSNWTGPWRAEAFYSRLEKNRLPPNDHIAGLRVGVKPLPSLESNVGILYQFGGKGRRAGNAGEVLIEILGGRVETGPGDHDVTDITNRAIEWDIRFDSPSAALPISLYTEQHLEDCCGEVSRIFKRSLSYLFGSAWKFSETSSLTLEYYRLGNLAYAHRDWPSGFSRYGRLLGHPSGRDSQGAQGFLSFSPLAALSIQSSVGWEEHQMTDQWIDTNIRTFRPEYEGSEKVAFITSSARYEFNRTYAIETGAGFGKYWAKDNVKSRSPFQWAAQLQLDYTFGSFAKSN